MPKEVNPGIHVNDLDGPNRIVGICNCSPGSCYGLRIPSAF